MSTSLLGRKWLCTFDATTISLKRRLDPTHLKWQPVQKFRFGQPSLLQCEPLPLSHLGRREVSIGEGSSLANHRNPQWRKVIC